jgi:aldehyde:ferredoxin oxidoreductase
MSGDAPVKNWGGVGMVDFPQGMVLSGDNVNRRMEKKYACWHCPVACGGESHAWDDQENQAKIRIAKRDTQAAELRAQLAAAADDQKQALEAQLKKIENDNKADADITNDARYPYPRHTHRAEYETMTSFGTMMLNNDINALHYANHLCNQYGVDTIAAGATVAFAMECYENGLITKEDTDGIDLRWGNSDAIIEALHKIGKKEGSLGEIFGDGVKAASEKIGPKSIKSCRCTIRSCSRSTSRRTNSTRRPRGTRSTRAHHGRRGICRRACRTARSRWGVAITTRAVPTTCTSSTRRACACSS